ncbi:MAG: amidohydrolase family protein [Promethearchaeota archaeon]
MIIDMHMHPFCKEATWPDLDKVAKAMWGTDPAKLETFRPILDFLSKETSIDDYIDLMDTFGIDKAVVVSFNVTTAYGICLVTNDDLADMISLYPDRLIGFAGIDVPAPDAMDQLEYAITSLELKGIKLVPPVQKFNITDSRYAPLWHKMIDLDIPLWTHTGHQLSTVGSVAKFGHPQLIDDLAMEHNSLKIIMGHMGIPWFMEAWSVASRHPNVYVDISAHPALYSRFPFDLFTKYNAEEKVLFASDHPLCQWSEIIPAIEALPLSNEFREKIMGKNAAKILDIKL